MAPGNWYRFASILVSSVALASATHAQTRPAGTSGRTAALHSGAGNGTEEVVVTAQRRSESINKIPLSIVAATGTQLRNLGIRNVADLQKIVPGFHYALGNYGAPIYAIRGVQFNDNSLAAKPAVALSIDEVPLPFPVMSAGANLDLERVEILKGPQGTLYGQNATGGAVNFISAKPTPKLSAGFNVDYGRFNALALSGYVSGPISDSVRIRVAGEVDRSDGWQQSYTRSASLGKQRLYNGRATVDWTPNNDFKARLSFNGYVDNSDTQAAQVIAITPLVLPPMHLSPGFLNYPLAPHDDRAADWDPGRSFAQNNQLYQVYLRLEYNLSQDLKLTSISAYEHYKLSRPVDIDGTSYQDYVSLMRGDANVASQEVRLSGTYHDFVRWIVGGNYEYDKVDEKERFLVGDNENAYALAPFGGAYFDGYDQSNQKFSTVAGFSNVDVDVTRQITVHGGVRFTRADAKSSGCTADGGEGALSLLFSNFSNILRSFSGLPGLAQPANGACVTLGVAPGYVPGTVAGKLDQNNVSWRAGADWKPRSDVLLYVNVSKGYKSGSFPVIAASVASQYNAVVQESVLAYEVGVKAKLAPGVQFNGGLFYYDYRNKQLLGRIIVPVFGPLTALVNVPKSSVAGGEAQLAVSPLEGLLVTMSGTYVHSRIDGNFSNYTPLGDFARFSGEAFPDAPQWQLDADAQYEWPITDRFNAFVGGNVSYQSKTNGGLGDLSLLSIDGYALIDLRAGVASSNDRWRLSVYGRNITNTYYWTNADRSGDTTIRLAGRPTTYGVALSYHF